MIYEVCTVALGGCWNSDALWQICTKPLLPRFLICFILEAFIKLKCIGNRVIADTFYMFMLRIGVNVDVTMWFGLDLASCYHEIIYVSDFANC